MNPTKSGHLAPVLGKLMSAGLRSPLLLKNSMPFHLVIATKAGLVSLIFRMSLKTWGCMDPKLYMAGSTPPLRPFSSSWYARNQPSV